MKQGLDMCCVPTLPSTCIDKNKKKNVPPDFSLPTESIKWIISFVRIISFFSLVLLLEHNYLLCTAHVLLSISLLLCKRKKNN